MIDIKLIRENPVAFQKAVKDKKISLNLNDLLQADQRLLAIKKQIQVLETERNENAKKVAIATPTEKPELISKGKAIAKDLELLKPSLQKAEHELQEFLWLVPNIPSIEAPIGESEDDNQEIKKWGHPPTFSFTPLDHVQMLEKNNWAEFQRICRVAGSRSYSLKNEMAELEFALIRFALDVMRKKGFTQITVPSMAREFAFFGTGHFPTGREQAYHLKEDDLYLAGTSEVLVNAIHGEEILNETELPILYAAFSPCFRREAGASGKDTRGLIRVHQFLKVEQFIICKNSPEESRDWHQKLLLISEEIMQNLELPYRVVDVCTGDMGPGKVRQFDIEAWVPSEKKYRETHSCSSLYEWQSRRTQTRYRDSQKKVHHCHTLNNTAIATPRILVPLLENHQTESGGMKVPLALQPYLGGRALLGG